MPDQSIIDPRRTAVLAMDLQHGFMQRFPEADEMLDRVNRAVGEVRARGGRVAWVRIGFTDADFDAVPAVSEMASMLTPERRQMLHADDPGTQLDARLSVQPEDIVVRKTRVGAFSTTDLDRQLHALGVDTLVLAGVATGGVVLTTTREATDLDYRSIVLSDATGDPDRELHALLVDRVFPDRSTVVGVDQLESLWGLGPAAD